MNGPVVSVAIANFNGARFLEEAVASALGQDLVDVEVIVVDDHSTDDSLARAVDLASGDSRIVVEPLSVRRGFGAARNRALDVARGEWLAILDSEDLMHPSRLTRLLALAHRDAADIVADNLLVFGQDEPFAARGFLGPRRSAQPSWVTVEDFLLETRLFGAVPDLGYLKPMIRLSTWRASGVRYDETLQIGEEQDLAARLLAAGLQYRIDPAIRYFYRTHAASASHRVGAQAPASLALALAEAKVRAVRGDCPPGAAKAMARRRASIATARSLIDAMAALKAGDPAEALRGVMRRPQALLLLRFPLLTAARRWLDLLSRSPLPTGSTKRQVCIISRQRLLGRTNGSSVYLLELAEAVRRAGLAPHLVQPSPRALGRWPVLRLKPEMAVFETIAVRGVLRLGPFIVACEPSIWLKAAKALVARGLQSLGAPTAWLNAKPAPYAIAAPWKDEDLLFVARFARRCGDILIADYAWQTEAFPYALRPRSPTAVVTHDLFHDRAASFGQGDVRDAALLDREEEARLLGRANAIIAIQKAEAEKMARMAPTRKVLLTPMTAHAAQSPQAGDPRIVLFVGSNAAPNVLGLQWMIDHVWPRVRATGRHVRLLVAGNVCRAFGPAPPGVRFLGAVERLDRLYARAGVVVSPLTVGSGLKIKLVEALALGKACVVTSVTVMGVEEEVAGAVALTDEPRAFAAAVTGLLADENARLELGARALAAVRAYFSPDRGQAAFVAWLRGESATEGLAAPRAAAPIQFERPQAVSASTAR